MVKSKQGFTLIELMTVVAIIGILAGIVLVSFPAAQDRAKDGRVMNAMDQLRTKMEICKGNNGGDYQDVTTCASSLETEINNNAAANLTDFNSTSAYCVDVQLNSGNYWCIDSSLHSLESSDSNCTAAGDTCSE